MTNVRLRGYVLFGWCQSGQHEKCWGMTKDHEWVCRCECHEDLI